jgi:competence protein ComEA
VRRRRWLAILGLLGALSATPAMAAPPSAPVVPSSTSAKAPDGVVNLNDASEEELERLPGIGPAKARAIVEHRRSHPLRKIDELVKVKGIGRKTFGRLRPYLTVVGPTTLKEKPTSSRK